MSVKARVRQTIVEHEMLSEGETLVVGVSGGPDSLCLLHVLREIANEMGVVLHVGHLDHGIRGDDSTEDARFVADLCAAWGIACTVGRRDVPGIARNRKRSLEEAARQARYAFLGNLARSLDGQSVAVAHNADDQAETVLMHFLRGSGLAGLGGMRPAALMDEPSSGQGSGTGPRIRLLRPLLTIARRDIESYCHQHGLEPRYDRTNLDTTLYRNRLRHELLPVLETYNPNIRRVLERTADVVAGEHALLEDLVRESWDRVVVEASEDAIVYDLAALGALKIGLQRALVRRGIRRLRASLRNVDFAHVESATALVKRGRVGSKTTLPAGLMLSIGYERATLASQDYDAPTAPAPRLSRRLELVLPGVTCLPDGDWRVETRLLGASDLPAGWANRLGRYQVYLDAELIGRSLALRPRQPGDRFAPFGMNGHQTIRAFMINARVPAAERDQVPLLLSGTEIAWVVGWRIDGRYAISGQTTQVASIHLWERSRDI